MFEGSDVIHAGSSTQAGEETQRYVWRAMPRSVEGGVRETTRHASFATLEHFPIRLAIPRVCKESFAFFFGNLSEKRSDRFPKRFNSTRLHFA